ncbi:MAG: MBL fold metallo-hydrolase [Burkholderiales bacterium]|jgi:glyoxylase-like metal-dependent hydrolase (beta-lactamase superfamily II)|nr:MBL fold metallo-hydrolase [Burkholderiales bacterium]
MLRYLHTTPPAPGAVVEIAPDVLWLRMPLPFALDHINLWLLRDTDGYVLVDCGYGDKATRELWERHFLTTLRDLPITRILVTHHHPDHLGNADWLMQRFACPLSMTATEFLIAHAIFHSGVPFTALATIPLFRAHGIDTEQLKTFATQTNLYRAGVPSMPMRYHRINKDIEPTLDIDTNPWEIITGYGHAPEHVSFYSPTSHVLISGDMLLPKISTHVSVWAFEPESDPLTYFFASLEMLAALPENTLVLPSHGLPFYGIGERIKQLREHHEERFNDLRAILRSSPHPLSAAEIYPLLFRRDLDTYQRFFAISETIAHLNHLWLSNDAMRHVESNSVIRFSLTE